MIIRYWESDIRRVDFCCQQIYTWLQEGLFAITVHPDQERCSVVLRISEEGEKVYFCPFCGAKFEFIME